MSDKLIHAWDKMFKSNKLKMKQSCRTVLKLILDISQDHGKNIFTADIALAERCGLTRKTVNIAKNWLVSRGIINAVGKKAKGVIHYHIDLKTLMSPEAYDEGVSLCSEWKGSINVSQSFSCYNLLHQVLQNVTQTSNLTCNYKVINQYLLTTSSRSSNEVSSKQVTGESTGSLVAPEVKESKVESFRALLLAKPLPSKHQRPEDMKNLKRDLSFEKDLDDSLVDVLQDEFGMFDGQIKALFSAHHNNVAFIRRHAEQLVEDGFNGNKIKSKGALLIHRLNKGSKEALQGVKYTKPQQGSISSKENILEGKIELPDNLTSEYGKIPEEDVDEKTFFMMKRVQNISK